jgi:hypothetical protein
MQQEPTLREFRDFAFMQGSGDVVEMIDAYLTRPEVHGYTFDDFVDEAKTHGAQVIKRTKKTVAFEARGHTARFERLSTFSVPGDVFGSRVLYRVQANKDTRWIGIGLTADNDPDTLAIEDVIDTYDTTIPHHIAVQLVKQMNARTYLKNLSDKDGIHARVADLHDAAAVYLYTLNGHRVDEYSGTIGAWRFKGDATDEFLWETWNAFGSAKRNKKGMASFSEFMA